MTRRASESVILWCILLVTAVHGGPRKDVHELEKLPEWRGGKTRPVTDWLLDQTPFQAGVFRGQGPNEIVLANGLIARTFRLAPNAATVGLDHLVTGEALLRGVKAEAIVVIDGVRHEIGGLKGQPNYAFLSPEWLDELHADPSAFQFVGWEVGRPAERLRWKRVRRHAPDVTWPPHGVSLRLDFVMPAPHADDNRQAGPRSDGGAVTGELAGLPTPSVAANDAAESKPKSGDAQQRRVRASVHYELYDGIPCYSKWLTLVNDSDAPIRIDQFSSEVLAVVERVSEVDELTVGKIPPPLHVETDMAMGGMTAAGANRRSYRWLPDPEFHTQVNYEKKTPCLLDVGPELGPGVVVAPGETFESMRVWVVPHDSTDRERQGLAVRRMYRTIAPWVTENPLMMHCRYSDEGSVLAAIDQCAEVGFEMVILTFGSGFDLENPQPATLATAQKYAAYARERQVEIGSYSLLASRSVGGGNDVVLPGDERPTFGHSPCLGSQWGEAYFRRLYDFHRDSRFTLLEHDGSYPGDVCWSESHPGHKGYEDSRWTQWRTIADFYRWCRSEGIFLNVPDHYFLTGSNKTGMGYREVNWSLPRNQQVIHTRQNIYDGTWEKTPSMGWMFVPLTEYHGGGPAATIEPLDEHLDHYERMLTSNLALGVQACYRGPRLYDTERTKAMVKRWVDWYKAHRDILESDLIHGRRADARDLDWMLHVNPRLVEKGLLVVFNPINEPVQRTVRVNLYYTGLTDRVEVCEEGNATRSMTLDRDFGVDLPVAVPPQGMKWFVLR